MPSSLPTDEQIRQRVRNAMQELIVRDSALAAAVVPEVQGVVMEVVGEFRDEVERLETGNERLITKLASWIDKFGEQESEAGA